MKKWHSMIWAMAALAAIVLTPSALAIGGPDMGEGELAQVDYGRSEVYWGMVTDYARVTLTISTPCGVIDRIYDEGKTPFFSIDELSPDDPRGSYTWQIRIDPKIDPGVREALNDARAKGDDEAVRELRRKGLLPKGPFIQTGSFSVDDNGIVEQSGVEKQGLRVDLQGEDNGLGLVTSESIGRIAEETVISGDLTVYNSLCVGFDCLNSETYGSDTIRLKENNLRIHADDTSTAASFPNQDWRLEFNSNLNGGAEYFRVIDATAIRNIFTLEANAPSNSLVVDDGGRVGMGTANPVVEIHVANGDTPTLRLDQTTASGFAAQVWDVAGNETSFFIRDSTNGSTLPFRIRPGASSNSLVIDTDDDVGIGVLSPTAALEVQRSNGTAKIRVDETSGTGAQRNLLELSNNGAVGMVLEDRNGETWDLSAQGNGFVINRGGSGVNELRIDNAGNLFVAGTQMAVPDYVFADDYELMSLSALAEFIEANHHLPNVPNEAQILAEGVNLTKFPLNLLEKVEELTLYTLHQQRLIDSLEARLAELEATDTSAESGSE